MAGMMIAAERFDRIYADRIDIDLTSSSTSPITPKPPVLHVVQDVWLTHHTSPNLPSAESLRIDAEAGVLAAASPLPPPEAQRGTRKPVHTGQLQLIPARWFAILGRLDGKQSSPNAFPARDRRG